MIIWINGAYGVGKSALAKEMNYEIKDSFIFDAEAVGNAIRDNMPKAFWHDTFEDYPLWCEVCYKLLKHLDFVYKGIILVPMTIIKINSYNEIIRRLLDDGIIVKHIILNASKDIIHNRIIERGEEEDCWCMQHIDNCLEGIKSLNNDITINSDNKSPGELKNKIIILLEL